jgi:hypothetical protein
MSKQEGGKKKNRSQASQKTLTKKARHKSSVPMNGRRVKAISPPLQADPGETSNLGKHLAAVQPALKDLSEYRDEDLAAKELVYWHAELDEVVPELGAGAKPADALARKGASRLTGGRTRDGRAGPGGGADR